MWKQTARKLAVLPPRRRSAPFWCGGGLLLLLLPAGFLGLGDASSPMTQAARVAAIVLGAGLLVSMAWALLARRNRGS